MADHLPDEITTEILTRLPAKSVFVFRSVCKTWRDIIDDPRFPSMHLNRATPNSSFIFFSNIYTAYILTRDKSNPEFFQTTEIEISSFALYATILYKRCVNGFISANYTSYNRVITQIFNPITRDLIQLPAFSNPPRCLTFGFGVDSSTGEYKVVYFSFTIHNLYMRKKEIQVFTVGLSSNSWRILKNVPDIVCRVDSIASVNGSLHWLTMENIARLDLASEKFTTIEHPPLPVKNIDILNMSGFLTLVAISSLDSRSVEVWIMKEYNVVKSWTRILIEKTPPCLHGMSIRIDRPFSLDKSGEMLIVYNQQIVSYNKGSYTPVYHHTFPISSRCIFPFTENLLPVQRLLQN